MNISIPRGDHVLVLEDEDKERKFYRKLIGTHFEVITTAKACIERLKERALQNEGYSVIFLDHDLGGEHYTPSDENSGFEVAKWLAVNPFPVDYIIVHSLNQPAAKRMVETLSPGYRFNVLAYPGAWKDIQVV